MKVVADSSLLLSGSDLPADIELIPVAGRSITNACLRDADALLLRSITTVDENLLHHTPVRFVGSATTGIDHLDVDYLNGKGIRWCNAAGSNADAVVDYCLAALGYLQLQGNLDITRCEIGIAGAGEVGGRFARRLAHLGCSVLLCDPPLAESQTSEPGSRAYQSLARISSCDLVSLHVPLIEQGKHPTRNLIDHDFLEAMPGNGILINTSRGEVVDEQALLTKLHSENNFQAVIDVWRDEPIINAELAQQATLATPHIAGHSKLAKMTAARQILKKLWQFGQAEGTLDGEWPVNPDSADYQISQRQQLLEAGNSCWNAVLQALPIGDFSASFKQMITEGQSVQGFDVLRRQFAQRREFSEYVIDPLALSESERARYLALGFMVKSTRDGS